MQAYNILIVEDTEALRNMLKTYLTKRGYNVSTASNGIEALAAINDIIPHLVITDVSMPDMNGYELVKRIRSDERTRGIIVIMLSAHNRSEDMLAGYEVGADDYVPKPVDLGVLSSKIEALLRLRASTVSATGSRRVITFYSPKGGAGVSTLLVNAGVSLALAGQKTIIFDIAGDTGDAPTLLDVKPDFSALDIQQRGIDSFSDEEFTDRCCKHSSGLAVLPTNLKVEDHEKIDENTLISIFERLTQLFDLVLIDAPHSLNNRSLAMLEQSDIVVLVTTPQLHTLRLTDNVLNIFDRLSKVKDRTVLVQNTPFEGGLIESEQVDRLLKRKPYMTVPYSNAVIRSIDTGQPFVKLDPDDKVSLSIAQLSHQLLQMPVLR